MWNRPNSSVKRPDLSNASLSQGLFFDCDLAVSSSQIKGKGFSKLNDKFAMSFLYDKIGMDLTTDIEKSMACYNPFVAISFKKFISGFFKRGGTGSFKRFLKPMEKSNISVGNLQNTSIMAVFIAIVRFVFKFTGMKTALSIDYASKISQIQRIVNLWFVKNSMFVVFVIELHMPSKVTSSLTSIHLKCV